MPRDALPQHRAFRPACRADVRFLIRGSSAVEQSAVNRSVAGSNPAPGANSGPLSLLGAALFASGADMPTRALPNESDELVDRVVAYQGRFRVSRYQFRHGLYQGGQSAVLKREVFERGTAAAVLPYDPRRDEVVLIRQFRAGSYVAGRHPFTWEIVAGIIEDGESPEDLARREAVEEASLEIRDVTPIHDVIVSPGACSEGCV